MSIRHRTPLLAGLAFAGLVALLAFSFGTATQAKPFTTASITGTYGFLMTEARVLDPQSATSKIEYCDVSGEIVFDPATGEAELDVSYRRCSEHVGGTLVTSSLVAGGSDTMNYWVDGGEIFLEEQVSEGDPSVTHGRILLKGNLLLFDGTSAPLDGGRLFNHGVVAKL